LPIRAPYGDDGQATIGANYLTCEEGIWFTLADCIASKFLNGKVPEIIEAITFAPGAPQAGLQPVCINGNPKYKVDPATDDFFKRIIELRQSIKKQLKSVTGIEHKMLDAEQHALKIAANSTNYGIFVETNIKEAAKQRRVRVHSAVHGPFESEPTHKLEQPGTFFHPLLATLITGAARLMLALTERRVLDAGLRSAFCDTDSMAIARPAGVSEKVFYQRVDAIVEWFTALNPYDFKGTILNGRRRKFHNQ
jgi:hypothetical protein